MSPSLSADAIELRPYPETVVPEVLARLAESPLLENVRAMFFPSIPQDRFIAKIRGIKTTGEFQREIIAPALESMLAESSSGFSISGFDNNTGQRKYVYVSNHRDIICDPALFTYGLVRHGYDSPLICLGDNLLSSSWIVDLVKVNRGVTVKRGLASRELLRWSHTLSEVIGQAVRSDEASVWIAQREGRAKDGNDLTQPGVVKMVALAGEGELLDRIASLHIVPVTISYEFDPCDALKAREMVLSEQPQGYHKGPDEDKRSMLQGIRGTKGRIHVEIGTEISKALAEARKLDLKKDQIAAVASELDRQIQINYRLWPSNQVAFDLGNGDFKGLGVHYTAQEREKFLTRMEQQIHFLGEASDRLSAIREKFIHLYANPVRNALRWRGSSR